MSDILKEVEGEAREIFLDKQKTESKKIQFINEIKGGLGSEIKRNPNKIKIIEKTLFQKIVLLFKKMFTKF